jgi:hypothetical protein
MAEAFHSATLQDPSLAAAMSAHYLAPLTPEQLDQVAVGAAGVVQGFDRMLPARLVTAGDMARLEKQGYVLVGALKPVNGFNPTPPPVPQDAAERWETHCDSKGQPAGYGPASCMYAMWLCAHSRLLTGGVLTLGPVTCARK